MRCRFRWSVLADSSNSAVQWILTSTETGPAYQPLWIVVSIGIATTCVLYFVTLQPTEEDERADLVLGEEPIVDPTTKLATT